MPQPAPTLIALALLLLAAAPPRTAAAMPPPPPLTSPDGRLTVTLTLNGGVLYQAIHHDGDAILDPSPLGLTLKEGGPLRNLRVVDHAVQQRDLTWRPVWGRAAAVRDHHRELVVRLAESTPPHREVVIVWRVFDDGVGFRYELPAQPGLTDATLMGEDTELRFVGDPLAWWIPADEFANESLYRETPLSEATHVNTPLTLRTDGGRWVSVHEAALVDYAEMTLVRTEGAHLKAHLWPWPDGEAVKAATTLRSPWRTLMVADYLGALAESHLILNLNEPCALDDTSFIEPMTFVGIWWGMHTGRWTWHAGERHGATTERALRYLDFAADHGVGGVLVEGWNLGWDTWGRGESRQDYLAAYPDFDLEAVAEHARRRGVRLIGHHETGGNVPAYEAQLEEALALYARLGVGSVKTGYAGTIVPEGMHHRGQFMVRHFQRVVEAAARHRVTLNVHEGVKPTGLERTWPNLMCTEAVRGMEWNATVNTIPPRHSTVLPFTRLLAGPADATPGIFRLDHAAERGRRVLATLANQLALYVVLHSPLMMLADDVEHYEGQPAFAFLRDVPTTWDESRVLGAEMNRWVVIARRRGDTWYVGGVTDHEARRLPVALSFLDPTRRYVADLYADAPDTDWEHAPAAITVERLVATAADTLVAVLCRAGGVAMRFVPAEADDLAELAPIASLDATADERLWRFEALRIPGDLRVEHLAVGAAVSLTPAPDPRYAQGGLTDGRVAGAGFQDPAWLGFEGDDVVATVDLGEPRRLFSAVLRVLNDPANWILVPGEVVIETSRDGAVFDRVARLEPDAIDEDRLVALAADLGGVEARHVRVSARQRPLPVGHPGHGGPGWIFVDEVELRGL